MNKYLVALLFTCTIVFFASGCATGSSNTSADTTSSMPESSTASSQAVAPDEQEASSAAASQGNGGESTSSNAQPAATSNALAGSQNSGLQGPAEKAEFENTATGTVVDTTIAQRASDVGYEGSDFANDTSMLTLLVLDAPKSVTASKGGSSYTGDVSVIRLPNDEMFRQFKDKRITIAVDTWGEFPADLNGMLYDIVLDLKSDGLTLVGEASGAYAPSSGTASSASGQASSPGAASSLLPESAWGSLFATMGDEYLSFARRAEAETPVRAWAVYQSVAGGDPVWIDDAERVVRLFNALAASDAGEPTGEIRTDDYTGFGFKFSDGTSTSFLFESMTFMVAEEGAWKTYGVVPSPELDEFVQLAHGDN